MKRSAFILLFLIVPIAFLCQQDEILTPYKQSLAGGVVNWDDGIIEVTAIAPISITQAKINKGEALYNAERAATVKAQAIALKVVSNVNVDSDIQIGTEDALVVRVKGIVQGGKVISTQVINNSSVSVRYQVPLNGVKGITSEVYETLKKIEPKKYALSKPVQKPKSAASATGNAQYTSIVLDTRLTRVTPALLPKIVDENGDEVHSAKTENKEAFLERGVAKYVTSGSKNLEKDLAEVGNNPFIISVDGEGVEVASSNSACTILALLQDKGISEPTGRKRGRGGYIVTASKANGALKSDIVVTKETADKLKEIDERDSLLRDGKVYVVIRSDVGGIEGLLKIEDPERKVALNGSR